MNTVLEQKLKELWQESLNQNAPALHVVTHLLLANYQQGSLSDFAKWCCQYNPGLRMEASIAGGRDVLPGEFPDYQKNSKDWIC
jgi:hypothetical protein